MGNQKVNAIVAAALVPGETSASDMKSRKKSDLEKAGSVLDMELAKAYSQGNKPDLTSAPRSMPRAR